MVGNGQGGVERSSDLPAIQSACLDLWIVFNTKLVADVCPRVVEYKPEIGPHTPLVTRVAKSQDKGGNVDMCIPTGKSVLDRSPLTLPDCVS